MRPHPREWVRSLLALCDLDRWGSVSRKAVACVDTGLRASLPTSESAAQGPLPAQGKVTPSTTSKTRVKAGEPLFVGHYSADGAWAFVETGYASGWVDSRDIALMDEDFAQRWQSLPQAPSSTMASPSATAAASTASPPGWARCSPSWGAARAGLVRSGAGEGRMGSCRPGSRALLSSGQALRGAFVPDGGTWRWSSTGCSANPTAGATLEGTGTARGA